MIWIILLLTAALFVLWGRTYARLWKQGVEAAVTVEEPYVYAGEKAHLTEIVTNRGRIPLPEIEARFRMPQGPVFENTENVVISDHLYKRDIFALRPREQIARSYILHCPQRGRYPVSDLTVKAKSFFHNKEYEISQNTDTSLTVYAAWTDVSEVLARCDVILGSLESRRRSIEDPFAWASIREYTTQDPMRSVNWKASARSGELMVNTYASAQEMKYCIFLDAVDTRIVKQERLVELGISAAASLARLLIKRGQEAGLYIYSDMEAAQLPPARSQEHLARIEELLTGDFTGFLRQKAGQSVGFGTGQDIGRGTVPGAGQSVSDNLSGVGNRTGVRSSSSFEEWAYRTACAEANTCICVFISKEDDSLRKLEHLLRTGARNGSTGQSLSAVLVQPLYEEGREKVRARVVV